MANVLCHRPAGLFFLKKIIKHVTSFSLFPRSFRLRPEMVPGHISLKLAEKIFFIGESIQLFEGGGGGGARFESQGAVLREREAEFYQRMAALRDQPEFLSGDFERFVDGIGDTASRHLHGLLMGGGGDQMGRLGRGAAPDLRHELATARDFFFLARGELFHTFIEQADRFLCKPPSATTQHGTVGTTLILFSIRLLVFFSRREPGLLGGLQGCSPRRRVRHQARQAGGVLFFGRRGIRLGRDGLLVLIRRCREADRLALRRTELLRALAAPPRHH